MTTSESGRLLRASVLLVAALSGAVGALLHSAESYSGTGPTAVWEAGSPQPVAQSEHACLICIFAPVFAVAATSFTAATPDLASLEVPPLRHTPNSLATTPTRHARAPPPAILR